MCIHHNIQNLTPLHDLLALLKIDLDQHILDHFHCPAQTPSTEISEILSFSQRQAHRSIMLNAQSNIAEKPLIWPLRQIGRLLNLVAELAEELMGDYCLLSG